MSLDAEHNKFRPIVGETKDGKRRTAFHRRTSPLARRDRSWNSVPDTLSEATCRRQTEQVGLNRKIHFVQNHFLANLQ